VLLDSIYENPAYLEDHSDPIRQFVLLEETIEVSIHIYIKLNQLTQDLYRVLLFLDGECSRNQS
jgi:hypothetical protein